MIDSIMNLFAACGDDKDNFNIKRIKLDASTQSQVINLFTEQEKAFRNKYVEEIQFNEKWKPDDNDLLVINDEALIKQFKETIIRNADSVDDIDINKFQEANIKALFMGENINGKIKILIQSFKVSQILKNRFTLFQDGNSFKKLVDASFSLASSLTCLIEDDSIKFHSIGNLRIIFNIQELYKEATKKETEQFLGLDIFSIQDEDIVQFTKNAQPTVKKLINAIMRSGVLANYDAKQIKIAADTVQLNLVLTDDEKQIIISDDMQEIKKFLSFLDDGLYEAALSNKRYITNSKQTI